MKAAEAFREAFEGMQASPPEDAKQPIWRGTAGTEPAKPASTCEGGQRQTLPSRLFEVPKQVLTKFRRASYATERDSFKNVLGR